MEELRQFKVELQSSGEQFSCRENQDLLRGMERNRVGGQLVDRIPVGCRGGGCGICRVKIVQGELETKKMSVRHVTPEQREQGIVLACRAYPRSDIKLLLDTPEVQEPQTV